MSVIAMWPEAACLGLPYKKGLHRPVRPASPHQVVPMLVDRWYRCHSDEWPSRRPLVMRAGIAPYALQPVMQDARRAIDGDCDASVKLRLTNSSHVPRTQAAQTPDGPRRWEHHRK